MQTEMHIVEPSASKPSCFKVEAAIERIKIARYWSNSGRTNPEGGNTIHSEIYKLILPRSHIGHGGLYR
jgi:hypothetical protein